MELVVPAGSFLSASQHTWFFRMSALPDSRRQRHGEGIPFGVGEQVEAVSWRVPVRVPERPQPRADAE